QARGNELALDGFPRPEPVKKLFLNKFLRDVHDYLFNADSSPRPGEHYKVRDEIRSRFVRAVKDAPQDDVHVVVSHSMGTVIAYDCLKNVADCPRVDALVTIGSPLGLDEVQDKLDPGYSRRDGYPDFRSSTPWVNLFDRLDPVCGFDPILANDFARGGVKAIDDVQVVNPGSWRHSAVKSLAQALIDRDRPRLGADVLAGLLPTLEAGDPLRAEALGLAGRSWKDVMLALPEAAEALRQHALSSSARSYRAAFEESGRCNSW